MACKDISLFNIYDLNPEPSDPDDIDVQEVVNYCEGRFRSILRTMFGSIEEDQVRMCTVLFRELVW